jgi:hypothetical protein
VYRKGKRPAQRELQRLLCERLWKGIEKINFVIENLAAPCFDGPAQCAEIVQHPPIGPDALLLRQEMLI